MDTVILDGTGKGNRAAVDNENHLMVHAVSMTTDEWVSKKYGEFFLATTPFLTIGTTEGLMFFLKNTSSVKNILIRALRIYSASADPLFLRVEHSTTKPTTNATIGTPQITNLNFKTPFGGDFLYWDGVGTGMTGHAAGTNWCYLINTGGAMQSIAFDRNYIIGYGQSMAVYANFDTATAKKIALCTCFLQQNGYDE